MHHAGVCLTCQEKGLLCTERRQRTAACVCWWRRAWLGLTGAGFPGAGHRGVPGCFTLGCCWSSLQRGDLPSCNVNAGCGVCGGKAPWRGVTFWCQCGRSHSLPWPARGSRPAYVPGRRQGTQLRTPMSNPAHKHFTLIRAPL
uniref:Uncharacterized protein n=1 Tax=Myotis myotis TaxID=51298 RepID=A0A7J7S2J5_MYOMY|nr:hypothetical protein mMyoMyo1_010094 [Myotis myotis]